MKDFTLSFALLIRAEEDRRVELNDVNSWRTLFRGGLTDDDEWKVKIEVFRPSNIIGYKTWANWHIR